MLAPETRRLLTAGAIREQKFSAGLYLAGAGSSRYAPEHRIRVQEFAASAHARMRRCLETLVYGVESSDDT